ncbi:MAG: SUMF1/EgtB/PvdO family nonheme iron enzyme [Chloroflexota bacterium]
MRIQAKMKVVTAISLILLTTFISLVVFRTSALSAQQPTPTAPAERIAGAKRVDEQGVPQVWIPSGTFIAGSTQEQVDLAYQTCLDIWPGMCLEQEYTAELNQHEMTLTYGFWMDQYEVTNTAFQEFVADGGYSQREYWSEDGWHWKGDKIGPNDAGCPREVLEPDMPRSCITWYEGQMLMPAGGAAACQPRLNGSMPHVV